MSNRGHGLALALLVGAGVVNGCSCEDGGGLNSLRPMLRVDPSSLEFGAVPLGKERTLALRLTNAGSATLLLRSVSVSSPTDEFILLTPAPNALAPSQSVELSVKYTSVAVGDVTGAVAIMSDDDQGPTSVAIHGSGVVPGLDVRMTGGQCANTPGSISFGTIAPGQTETRTITLVSTQAAPVEISSAVLEAGASGEWTLSGLAAGGVTLNQNEQLQLTATYTPSDSGADMTAYIITTNVPSRMNIRIPACGVGAQPALCATPIPLDMGTVGLGSTAQGVLHISNCSSDPFDLVSLDVATDAAHPSTAGFHVDHTSAQLPVTLQAGEAIDVDVSYSSTVIGSANGWLHAHTSAVTEPDAYLPVLSAVRDTCQILVAPGRVIYNDVVAGTSARQNVLIANNGSDACTILSQQITTGANLFSILTARQAPYTLESGASETIVVRYQPLTFGGMSDRGVLNVTAGATVHPVELLGNPPLANGCQMEVTPSFINFGAVPRGQTRLRSVDVRNVSESPCTLRSASLDPSSSTQFTNVQFAAGTVDPGAHTQVLVNYRSPVTGNNAMGLVHIETDDVDSPTLDVQVFGSVAVPSICVDPLNLDFGTINNGTMDFTVHACGSIPVTVTDLAFTRSDPEFSLRNPPQLPLTLQPGESQNVTVLYESADAVGDSAIITVGSDDPVQPTIQVGATAGPVIVPPAAGHYLYYWQIDTCSGGESNIMRMPLQGQPTPEAYWGPRAGKVCTGCHGVSPDGRYVAVIEATNFQLTVIDTTTDIEVTLPFTVQNTAFFTWKPDVNSNPPYQFAYDENDRVKIASIVAGYIGELQGANDPAYGSKHPSWGANGQIAFARGSPGGGWGFFGPSDVMIVDENGGVATPLAGASANGGANYYPAFHPNGQWVAFNHSASAQGTISAPDGQIWMAPTNQSGTVLQMPMLNCPPGQCASSFPTWSIDGSFLSFSSNRVGSLGSWDLYVAPVDPLTGADSPAMNIIEANTCDFQHAARWAF